MHLFITSSPLANGAHTQYSVRGNLGRHMRSLSTLMIGLQFSSWKRVAESTDRHIKTATQAPTRTRTQLQPALGLFSASHNMFKMAEKKGVFTKGRQ